MADTLALALSSEPADVLIILISGTKTWKRVSSKRAVFNVSSIRVPRCNSTCTLKRPLSPSCIKSVPINPINAGINEAKKIATTTIKVTAL